MIKTLAAAGLGFVLLASTAFSHVLIVADEFSAMQVVAGKLKSAAGIDSKIVWQTNFPSSLAMFQAVVVYIHHDLSPAAEEAFIKYTEEGGRLVVLHHSIASGKRKNPHWFSFLEVKLPEGDLAGGGYKWIEGVTWSLVNLNPRHFIVTNQVVYPDCIPFGNGDSLPGFTLDHSEVYLNHVHTGPREMLMGLNYTDAKSGLVYNQPTAGWVKKAGRGWIVYLMPGHTAHDFENTAYGRIVVNAVVWPGESE